MQTYNAKRRAFLLKSGLCRDCEKKVTGDHTRCKDCLKVHRVKSTQYRNANSQSNHHREPVGIL